MTYGTLDGTVPPPEKHKYEPQQYTGGDYSDSSQGALDAGGLPTIPGVPANGTDTAGSKTSVDTSSLKTFADNLDTLADAVDGAYQRVVNLKPLAPGGHSFAEAQNLKKAVTGDKGDAGLQPSFVLALHHLQEGLMKTARAIRDLANKYSSLEDLNREAGKELSGLIKDAQGYINTVAKDPL
ncbi:hypothetical protein M2271_008339 [Streptomyces sp. LBL]|uniref:hypothetical protein n=1 Tax=Streptomyces sp. LBL TaxID=2940562 RepID=UPI0024750E5C|nr:hypothetical protein [Streptomyces sp. LBL]MDH6630478.1 hypothetical protein [Streptomyces sp. LBL]